ncbi:MAG: hypothetical protein JWR77_111 [Rhizorhabdus sp.]|nr:hypothetical protein [Rhizorhabdus sp.]
MTTALFALAAAMLLLAGYWFGRRNPAQLATPAPERGEQLLPVARHLLLGRLASGMTHELSQSLNVIAMANGNLDYILDGLAMPDEPKEQVSSRVRRIAAHCHSAAQIISHFHMFGQDNSRDKGVMTVGSAIDRAIETTRADFRPSGIGIEIGGDACDLPTIRYHGTIEMITASLLLAMRQILTGCETGASAPIRIEAGQSESELAISLSCETDALRRPEGIDAVTTWLASEITRERGGTLTSFPKGAVWFTLRFDRGLM